MVLCTSGTHGWIDPADAERCCNGWRQELAWRDDPHGVGYHFVWVRDADATPQRPPHAASASMSGDLRLAIELVPQPLWRQSLATVMPRADWNRLRERVKAESDYRCAICGAGGTLHCHEVWRYDDVRHIQSLAAFKAICAMCHHVKHIGHSGILAAEGKLNLEDVIQHFTRVNGCDRDTFERHKAQAFRVWEERSRHTWTIDYGAYASSVPSPQLEGGD